MIRPIPAIRAASAARRSRIEHNQERFALDTASKSWKVFALFNHDLGQVFIGASDAPRSRLSKHCEQEATSLVDWRRNQRIEWMETVEEFPEKDHAVAYANWLYREGAFEGVEDYSIGLDSSLRASRTGSRAN